jgi:hypothetical protein
MTADEFCSAAGAVERFVEPFEPFEAVERFVEPASEPAAPPSSGAAPSPAPAPAPAPAPRSAERERARGRGKPLARLSPSGDEPASEPAPERFRPASELGPGLSASASWAESVRTCVVRAVGGELWPWETCVCRP